MTATEIRAERDRQLPPKDFRLEATEAMLSVRGFFLAEIAAQLSKSNQLARLRLRMRLAEESIYSPAMRADIVAEIREELEKL